MSFRYKRDWQGMGILGLAFMPIYILASCTQAQAQTADGNMLFSQCQSGYGYETPYILGVVAGLSQFNSQRFCLPPGSVGKQYRDVVCRGLLDNPELRHADAAMITHAILSDAFPCQSTPSPTLK